MIMKRLILFFAVLAFALSACTQELVILHLNDTHSHIDPIRSGKNVGMGGVVEQALYIDEVRAEKGKKNVSLPFGVDAKDVQIVVHPQSIVHSLVQFADNSVIAQMSLPSMKLPIQYALTYPQRVNCGVRPLDLTAVSSLTFADVDEANFPSAKLGHEVYGKHPLLATVLNAANDVAVDCFLKGEIAFLSIYSTVRYMIDTYEEKVQEMDFTLQSIKEIDALVRKHTKTYLENLIA